MRQLQAKYTTKADPNIYFIYKRNKKKYSFKLFSYLNIHKYYCCTYIVYVWNGIKDGPLLQDYTKIRFENSWVNRKYRHYSQTIIFYYDDHHHYFDYVRFFFYSFFFIVFFITIYFFCVIAYPFQYFSKDWSRKNKPKMYENSNGRKWNWGTFVIWPSHKQTTKQNEREKKKTIY